MRVMDWIMRIAAYTVFISLILTSCSTINLINGRLAKLTYVDSAIKPYTQRFVGAANRRNIPIPEMSRTTIVFGTTRTKDEPNTIGVCEDMQGWPLITISEDYWAYSDDSEKEQLIFHELGHCVLGRDHCDTTRDGHAISIMESEMGSSYAYQIRREELVSELFSPDAGCSVSEKKDRTVPHKNGSEADEI